MIKRLKDGIRVFAGVTYAGVLLHSVGRIDRKQPSADSEEIRLNQYRQIYPNEPCTIN